MLVCVSQLALLFPNILQYLGVFRIIGGASYGSLAYQNLNAVVTAGAPVDLVGLPLFQLDLQNIHK